MLEELKQEKTYLEQIYEQTFANLHNIRGQINALDKLITKLSTPLPDTDSKKE